MSTLAAAPAKKITPPRVGPRVAFAVLTGLAAAIVVAVTTYPALNGDVTYAFGGIETAGRSGVGVADVFVARPMAYRLLLGGLDGVRKLFGVGPASHVGQLIIRGQTDLLVCAVTMVLFVGIRRFVPVRVAVSIAVATTLVMVVAPPWHFLEPDWVAALAAVLAVGAACAPRQVWVGALLGGTAALLAVSVKLATAPIALLALLLVAVLHRRRAVGAASTTVILGIAWYALTRYLLPWEWIWLKDQAALVEDSPIHHGLRLVDLHHLIIGTGDVAILCPIVVAAPAAATALILLQPAGRPRLIGAAVAIGAAGLSVASAYGQAEYFSYHFAIVPVLAAGVCAAAFALSVPARGVLMLTALVMSIVSFVLMRQSVQWRVGHASAVTMAYFCVAAIAALAIWRSTSRTSFSAPWLAAVIVLCATIVQPALPGTPYSFSTYNRASLVRRPTNDGTIRLSERIGRDTPVLYLTFGTINMSLGNPTTCRYPSPQWLQRGAIDSRVRTFPSYFDNLKCLTDDHSARYLIWQRQWFPVHRANLHLQSLLWREFDCSPADRIPSPSTLVVCPARHPS